MVTLMVTNERECARFEIIELEQINEKSWRVGGRALKNIQINDVLLTRKSVSPFEQTLVAFEVVKIVIYGKSIDNISDSLSGGLTGWLTLEMQESTGNEVMSYLYNFTGKG